jgi:hypothetical protein
MPAITAHIIGHWKTRTVQINGNTITPTGFIRDLEADAEEPGENKDIIKECIGVRSFAWGEKSRATYCLALACCFYLKVKWVMDRFFRRELERQPKTDLQLSYDDAQLDAAYEQCEELFAQEFKEFMAELGAVPLDEEETRQ